MGPKIGFGLFAVSGIGCTLMGLFCEIDPAGCSIHPIYVRMIIVGMGLCFTAVGVLGLYRLISGKYVSIKVGPNRWSIVTKEEAEEFASAGLNTSSVKDGIPAPENSKWCPTCGGLIDSACTYCPQCGAKQ